MATETDLVERAARAAHNVNAEYCQALGDTSQPDWEDAPAWQRESAMAGVRAIAQNPGITPSKQHELWMEIKAAEGWVYGETKDPEAKTHPCMVPYNKLPIDQRAKDYLFGIVVRGVLGLRLPRLVSR